MLTNMDELRVTRDNLLNRKELSKRWGCSVMTITRLDDAGKLKSVRLGSRMIRYRLEDVIEYEMASKEES